jgi:hypothetical protein
MFHVERSFRQSRPEYDRMFCSTWNTLAGNLNPMFHVEHFDVESAA